MRSLFLWGEAYLTVAFICVQKGNSYTIKCLKCLNLRVTKSKGQRVKDRIPKVLNDPNEPNDINDLNELVPKVLKIYGVKNA